MSTEIPAPTPGTVSHAVRLGTRDGRLTGKGFAALKSLPCAEVTTKLVEFSGGNFDYPGHLRAEDETGVIELTWSKNAYTGKFNGYSVDGKRTWLLHQADSAIAVNLDWFDPKSREAREFNKGGSCPILADQLRRLLTEGAPEQRLRIGKMIRGYSAADRGGQWRQVLDAEFPPVITLKGVKR